jgi:hypothetical protein
MRHRLGACFVAAASALTGAGCYGYVPVEPATPEPGTQIRADVSQAAADRLIPTLGPGVIQLRGMVVEQQPDRLSMVVDVYSTARSGDLSGDRAAIWLPFNDISAIEEKKLSTGRSVILGAGFIAGALTVTAIVANSGRQLEDEDDPDPGGTERRGGRRILLPIFAIRF